MLTDPRCQLLYPFQNQANDYSGFARHGTINGSGIYATRSGGGRCLYFDGTGDYVATPSFGLSGTVVVFACWMRNKWLGTYQTFLSDNAQSTTIGFLLFLRYASTQLMWQYADGVQSGGQYVIFNTPAGFDDSWVYVAIVCDYAGKHLYVYYGGALSQTLSLVNTPVFPSANRTKYIGTFDTAQFLIAQGYLQDIQLWSLPTMPPAAQMLANVNRIMLGLHPIW